MSLYDGPRPTGWHQLVVEPRRPERIRNRPDAYRWAVAAVCIGAFMGQLDASIVTQAFPALERTFHTGVSAVTWVGLSYLLVLVATVAAVGRFADMVGRKLLYVYGFLLFVAGSALCAFAPGLGALCAFRVIQAVGAAMLQANSVAIIALASPSGRLGRSLGIQGAAQATGLALGPTVGGLLLAAGGWRLLFLVNVPVGLVGVVAGVLFIPRSRHLQARVEFDWPGFALFFPAVVALLAAVSLGNAHGWTSPMIVGLAVGAVALALLFVRRERRCSAPMLDPALFRRVRFVTGVVAGMLSFAVLFGVLMVVPFLLEDGRHLGPARAGLELMVLPLALGIVAPFAGRVADRLGTAAPTVAGLVVTAGGLVALALLVPATPGLLAVLAVIGAGLGLFTSPNNAGVMGSVPAAQSGLASGVLNMARGLGTAVGLAVSGAVLGHLAPDLADAGAVRHGVAVTAAVLAGLAVVAAAVAVTGAVLGRREVTATGDRAGETDPVAVAAGAA